jgi:hypothetical protein
MSKTERTTAVEFQAARFMRLSRKTSLRGHWVLLAQQLAKEEASDLAWALAVALNQDYIYGGKNE